jgi:hypothetical protein
MARPPGKRVSNISLLSGGEKGDDRGGAGVRIFQAQSRRRSACLDEVDARWAREANGRPLSRAMVYP